MTAKKLRIYVDFRAPKHQVLSSFLRLSQKSSNLQKNIFFCFRNKRFGSAHTERGRLSQDSGAWGTRRHGGGSQAATL